MTNLKYSIGIDMAKADFKACVSQINDQQRVIIKSTATFKNTTKGFEDFLRWTSKHCKENLPSIYLMEATGIYYEHLAWYLHNKDCKVSVILPNKAKRYLQSIGLKSKNDKIDAAGLARMAAEQSLSLWNPISKNIYKLRALTRLHEDISGQRSAILSRIEALNHSMYEFAEVNKSVKKVLQALEKELLHLEKQIKQTITDDTILNSKFEKISLIKGIALMSFAVVVAETNGFELFKNEAQLISYAGYDVIENQSGSRTGKTRISKKGNTHIRRVLHMPALTAVKYEQRFKAFYERIYGKTQIKMKAYVAVQRKLLSLMYTLWKKDAAYDPNWQPPNHSEAEIADPLWGDSGGIKKPTHQALAH